MRVLYATGQLAFWGGAERVTAIKLNYLADHGYEVFLSTYEQMGRPFVYPVCDNVKHVDLGIDYNLESIGGSLYSGRCMKMVPKHYRRTKNLIKKIKPDVIVVPNSGYEFWFMPFIKGKARIVREFHNSQFERNKCLRWKDRFKYFVDNYILKKYDAVVLLTPEEKEYFPYKNNLYVIPNPVNGNNLQCDLNSKIVISTGRLAPVKGFESLIEIASRVIPLHPEYSFEVYGNGEKEYVNSLENLVKKYNLTNNFFFKGVTDDVPSKLMKCCIYVCTSHTECFPMSLLEAHEVGLPIVSFDCPNGPRNIITNGVNGILVKNQSIEDAAKAILNLIENPDLKKVMGKNAHVDSKRFNIEKIMKMWIDLFEIKIWNEM